MIRQEVYDIDSVGLQACHCVSSPGEVMTPNEKKMRARLGGLSLSAQRDPREYTKAARSRFMAKFYDEVDADGVLDEREKERRAEAARKAHFTRMALKSGRKRNGKNDQKSIRNKNK